MRVLQIVWEISGNFGCPELGYPRYSQDIWHRINCLVVFCCRHDASSAQLRDRRPAGVLVWP